MDRPAPRASQRPLWWLAPASTHLTTRTDPGDRRVRLVVRTPLGDRTSKAVTASIRRVERAWARRVGAGRYEEFRAVLEDLVATGSR